MKQKKFIIAAVLLMAVGFAAVATSIYINGSTTIGANTEDFDVRFVKSIIDGEDKSDTTISADGKSITFDTKDLRDVGDSSKLDFVIMNNSSQYDVDISVTCNYDTTQSEFLTVTRSIPSHVNAKESEAGWVNIELKKAATVATDVAITCELAVNALERGNTASGVVSASAISFSTGSGEGSGEGEGSSVTNLADELNSLRTQINELKNGL